MSKIKRAIFEQLENSEDLEEVEIVWLGQKKADEEPQRQTT